MNSHPGIPENAKTGSIMNLRQRGLLNRWDIERLLPALQIWLHNCFLFKKLSFIPLEPNKSWDMVSSELGLAPRHLKQLEEAIQKRQGFWDRVNLRLIMPIYNPLKDKIKESPTQEDIFGLLIFSDIDKTIGPQESERLLPILQEAIQLKLLETKLEQTICPPGIIPQYVKTTIDNIISKNLNNYTIFRISLPETDLVNKTFMNSIPRDIILAHLKKYLPSTHIEWLGGSHKESWYLINEDNNNIKKILDTIILTLYKQVETVPSLISIALEDIQNCTSKEVILNITQLLDFSKMANSHIIDYKSYKRFCEKLGVQDIVSILKDIYKLIKKRGKFLIASIISDKNKILFNKVKSSLADNKKINILEDKNSDIYFIIKQVTGKVSIKTSAQIFQQEIQNLLKDQAVESSIGIAFQMHKSIDKKQLPFIALMAGVHADMLGNRTIILSDAVTWNVIGDEFLSWGDIWSAINAFKTGIKIDTNHANIYNSLGVCLAEIKEISKAYKAFSKAAALKPDDFMIQYNLAGVLASKGDKNRALQCLKTANELHPENTSVTIKLAYLLLETEQPQTAIEILTPIISDKKCRIINAYRIMGRAYLALDKWEQAQQYLKKALNLKPSDPHTLALLALGYIECAKDPTTAARLARQAEARSNGGQEIREILGRIYLRLGDQQGVTRVQNQEINPYNTV